MTFETVLLSSWKMLKRKLLQLVVKRDEQKDEQKDGQKDGRKD